MALNKLASMYKKKDRTGAIYLVGKVRETIPEGTYLYVFPNKGDGSGKKKYETSADFYACIQVDGEGGGKK